ncbi:MAG: FadR/GntR family transcriptional regulator [Eubacteriales bacterium]
MTRVDTAVIEIKQMILEQKYDEYGYLPSEGVMSELLGVSRATVREAVRTLEVRGFLKRIHGKGIQVLDKSQKVVEQAMTDMFEKQEMEVVDVLEVRMMIEPKSAELAASRINHEELKMLNDLVGAMEKSAKMDEKYLESDFKFHKLLAASTKNPMIMAIVAAYSKWLEKSIFASSQTDENLEHNYHYHRNILEALERHDAYEARKYMEQHLEATCKQTYNV